MTEEQKQKIVEAAVHCEKARGFAAYRAQHGDLDAVHSWVEISRMWADRAFQVAQS